MLNANEDVSGISGNSVKSEGELFFISLSELHPGP